MGSALHTTAGGIRGYWDGTQILSVNRTINDDWERFAALDATSRANLIGAEFMAMLQVTRNTQHIELKAGAAQLLGLDRMDGATADTVFTAQLAHMPGYAALRGDRMTEIMMQTGDLLSFYNSLIRLDPNRAPNTVVLLNSFSAFVNAIAAQVKFHVTAKRPIDYSRHVMPIIPTPSHSSLPSGHATNAFAVAHLISQLEPRDPGNLQNEHLFRMAARIADNRVVAGVHFPIDNRVGSVLGYTIADYVAAHLGGGGETEARDISPAQDPAADFTLDSFAADLIARSGPVRLQGATVPVPAATGLLATLWDKARAEWL